MVLVAAMHEQMHERTGKEQDIRRQAQGMRPMLPQNVERDARRNGRRQHDQEPTTKILRRHAEVPFNADAGRQAAA